MSLIETRSRPRGTAHSPSAGAAARGGYRGGKLPPLPRPRLPAPALLAKRDGHRGPIGRRRAWRRWVACSPIRPSRSYSTTPTTTSACSTGSTVSAPATLFDTRIAAQLLNEPGVGLAALLEKYLGVRLDKRFQRADWSARPLSPGHAGLRRQRIPRYLPELRDILRPSARRAGPLGWAEEEFGLLTATALHHQTGTSRPTSA